MTSLFTGFNYAPDAFLFEIITKILIANAFWLPIHLFVALGRGAVACFEPVLHEHSGASTLQWREPC